MRHAPLENVSRLLRTKSIAFVGGHSMEPAIAMSHRAGFSDPIRAVHPHHETLDGIADLLELPDATLSLRRP